MVAHVAQNTVTLAILLDVLAVINSLDAIVLGKGRAIPDIDHVYKSK